MPNVADYLKAGFSGLSLDEALQLPASALLGITNSAADALRRTGVETIFDLGSSWLFANASAAIEVANGEPALSRAHLLDDLPTERSDDAASLSLERLRGISDEDALAVKQALSLETIREFALWPPRRVAQRLLSEASGADIDSEEAHAEALRPRLGEFPTERVYYNSLVMLGMTASGNQQPLTGMISLQPAVDDPAGFGHPAVGALVTFSQSWYAKGITLGHMLHSLALAPGEATRIAVVDWSRRTRAATSETIDEAERLDNATSHSRAISEVQNAVANEMQSGGSMSSGWAKSTSTGKAGGFSIGGGVAGSYGYVAGVLGFGGGIAKSTQESETNSEATSTSWSIGNRSVMAEMSQRVNDRTEQHSNSVRNRRASAVREVSQSEHEQVSTRVVANYNHMHALTMQYYEVVQIYRVLVELHSAQRVLFLPFELLDFSGEKVAEVVARFRRQLLAAALSERVVALLLDDRGEVEIRAAVRVQVPPLFSEVRPGNLPTSFSTEPTLGTGGGGTAVPTAPSPTVSTVLTAPGPVRRITSPGPLVGNVPGDVELVAVSFDGVHVDRARFDQAGVPGDNSTFAVPSTTFKIDFPGGLPLRNVTAIHITKMDGDADSGTMTLHCRNATQQLALPVPLDLAAGTSMQKVAFLAADPSNRTKELMAHLQANRAYYSQAVVRNLDSATLAMLLSRFTLMGKPLADQVEPNPLAVAGNYLVLRAPIEDNEAAGIDDIATTWGDLLRARALTSEQRDDRLVPIPTGGVFAEAVLGRSNSAEKLDLTRFWNWQDSPIPLQPSEIAPISVGTRGAADDLRASQLGTPILNILGTGSLPEPAGLTAALNTLANGSLFRDMSGLAGTQALAQAASAGTLSAATEAGKLASANLKTVTDQAVAMGQAAADMWKVLQTKGSGGGDAGGGAGSRSNISADGARINHGRDMDERGVSDAGVRAPGSGSKMTSSTSEFQPDSGGGGNTGGTVGPIKRELAFADTQATGVSTGLFGELTNTLKGVVARIDEGTTLASTLIAENLILSRIHDDVVASGASLQGVKLRPMREHRHNKRFRAIQIFAWTNSGTDIFIDTEAFIEKVATKKAQNFADTQGLLFARGWATVLVRHETTHIVQFRQTGKPVDFIQMLKYEREAYGCEPPPALPNSQLKWLDRPDGAVRFLVDTLKLLPVFAQDLIDELRAGTDVTEGTADICDELNIMANLTNPDPAKLDSLIKDEFINRNFLPERLLERQTRGGYSIGDLYKP